MAAVSQIHMEDFMRLGPEVEATIIKRLAEFKANMQKGEEYWFSELCFCILTANSRASSALKIQAELGPEGFCRSSQGEICSCIMKYKHRFHNNKSRFIMGARSYKGLKQAVMTKAKVSEKSAREEIVGNIKGIGYKEASHFMRNMGYDSLAILDRHILRLLAEREYIDTVPKLLTPKKYLETERVFQDIAGKLGITAAELDLRMWYIKTGKVLK